MSTNASSRSTAASSSSSLLVSKTPNAVAASKSRRVAAGISSSSGHSLKPIAADLFYSSSPKPKLWDNKENAAAIKAQGRPSKRRRVEHVKVERDDDDDNNQSSSSIRQHKKREEETNFMNSLLAGLEDDPTLFLQDDELFASSPKREASPVADPPARRRDRTLCRSPPTTTPTPKIMLTPIKPIASPTHHRSSGDEFDELDFPFDEFDLPLSPSKLSPRKQVKAQYPVLHPAIDRHQHPNFRPTPWARTRVVDVKAGETNSNQWGWGEKIVRVRVERAATEIELVLRDEFATLAIAEGDVINVISPELLSLEEQPKDGSSPSSSNKSSKRSTSPPPPLPLTVSMRTPQTHIIHHPDVLLPMTTISQSITCRRRPLISGLVRGGSPAPTKPLLYGNILHELLQTSLSQRTFEASELKKHLDEVLGQPRMMLDIWAAGLGMEEVRGEVWEKASLAILGFGSKWIGKEAQDSSLLHNTKSKLAISGLHEIEESIWSPKWGMKGKVDASVEARISEVGSSTVSAGSSGVQQMPLEIKTGRSVGVMEHRAQTMLYTFLMEERYQAPVSAGLLYYTQSDAMLRVSANKNEVRSLLHARNELAGYLSRQRVLQESPSQPGEAQLALLPPTIDSPRDCQRCYQVDGCMLYRKAVDRVPVDADDPLADLYAQKTSHLLPRDVAFFSHWEKLISLEEQDIFRFKHQLWTMTALERERTGRCFANMVITHHQDVRVESRAKIHQHSYTFQRKRGDAAAPAAADSAAQPPLLNGHIGKGDPVSLTIEPDLISIARGFVVELRPKEVVIGTDLEINVEALLQRSRTTNVSPDDIVFRIDKDEMISGTSRMRDNLARLFLSDEAGGDARRRELIVDLVEPVFEEVWAPNDDEVPAHLNSDQRDAMHKVMTAKDYALILGMPGTGKTTTIAEIILALVARGKRVLLTSYTHSAVDTILMKLVNSDQKILRLGNADKVHPDVSHLTLDACGTIASLSELEARLMEPQIVATTCLSIDHPIFSRRSFDYCIVDEASQITLPTCVGPLRLADTFVLVGDHYQLPPIVKNADARRGGLDASLFKTLSEAHPGSVVDLTYQYRMNKDIMSLSNKLIYGERLKCGSDQIATQVLQLPVPFREAVPHDHCTDKGEEGSCWIEDVLSPKRTVCFVNTDRVPGNESRVGDLVQNTVEMSLVQQLAFALIRSGIRQEDVGIITPYRQQIKILSHAVQEYPGLEVLTADKSQGRDKDCIIISMVRSNDHGSVGELLRDWRRINVSFTRAKKKLIVIGSRSTLSRDRLLSDFCDIMAERDWIYTLRPEAHVGHQTVLQPAESLPEFSQPVKDERSAKLGERLLASRPFIREALALSAPH